MLSDETLAALRAFTTEMEAALGRLRAALDPASWINELPVSPAPAAGEKHCLWCGKLLTPKLYASGRQEPPSVFKRRKLCDKTCSAKWRHSTQPESQERFRRGRKAAGAARTRKAAQRRKQQAVALAVQPASASAAVAPAPEPARPARRAAAHANRPALTLQEPLDTGGPLSIPAGAQLCPTHGDRIGPFGCPACNAAAKWRHGERNRARQIPHAEEGLW